MTEDRSSQVLAVAIVFFALSWTSTLLRGYVRAIMLKSYRLDDSTMLLAQVLFTGYLICQIGGWKYGTGRHLDVLIPWRASRALCFWFFCELFYILSTAMLKVSVSLFLLRVATNRYHKWVLWSLILIVTGSAFASLLIFLFQCKPIDAWWSLDPHSDKCVRVDIITDLTYIMSCVIVVADWTLGLLPIWIVKGLPLSAKQKSLVALILAFAAIASTATIVRLAYVETLAQSYQGRDGEFLYGTVDIAIWTTVEVGVGITAGSLATLRPLLRSTLDRLDVLRSTRSQDRHPKNLTSPTPIDQLPSTSSYDSRRKYRSCPAPGDSQEQLGSYEMSESTRKSPVVDYSEVVTITEAEEGRGGPARMGWR